MTFINRHIKIFVTFITIVVGVLSVYAFSAHAAFNRQINYQGKLTNASNVAVADGGYNMRFKLYTTPNSATTSAIWTETWCYSPDSGATCDGTVTNNRINVTNGLFSVMLGSTTPLTGIDFNQTLYLGVEIGGTSSGFSGDGEMLPRKRFGAVPAAFVADTLQGLSPVQFFRTDSQNATSSTSTFLNIIQSGAGKIAELFGANSASVFTALSNGNVGVGTSTPYATFSVNGQIVAGYLTATTSTASTFPYASSTALTVSGTASSSNIIASNSLKIGNITGALQAIAGTVSASSSLSTIYGGTEITNPSAGGILAGTYAGGKWQQIATSSLGLLTTNVAEGSNLYYLDSRVQAFIHASTTIPKTYTANTYTAGQTFSSGATTTAFAITSIASALLKTNSNGSVIAAIAGTDYLTSANLFAFPWTATTFGASAANSTSTLIGFTNGIYALASSTIGAGGQTTGLTINGGATTTGNAYFAGNVGIGSTSPAALLSIFNSVSTPANTPLFMVASTTGGLMTSTLMSILANGAINLTGGSATGTAVAGGALTFTGGIGSGGVSSVPAGAGGAVTITGGTGGASPNNSAANGGAVSITSGTNSSNGGTSGTLTLATANGTGSSGQIGDLSITAGGAVSTGSGTVNGGRILVSTGVGEGRNQSSGTTGGNGGAFSITGGAGGSISSLSSGTGTAGNGAGLTFTSGAGGGATGSGGTRIAGNSGNIVFQVGAAGVGDTTNGSVGNFQFLTGNVGIGTSTPYSRLTAWSSGSIFEAVNSASTTVLSVGQNGATTTAFAISSIASALLKTNANGSIIAAIAGTDYLTAANIFAFPFTTTTFGASAANSTSTLIGFTNGLYALASSTIGAGGQTTGLTINGGATTTGNAYFASTIGVGTTSPYAQIGVVGNTNYSNVISVFNSSLNRLFNLDSTANLVVGSNSSNGSIGVYNGGAGNLVLSGNQSTGNAIINNANTVGGDIDIQSRGSSALYVKTGGNIGIGSSTPFYKLSVEGNGSFGNQVIANYFTATSTLVASTFPYASTTALTVSGTNGLQLASGLTGILQSVAGLVTSSSTLSINYGGTGLNTKPSYGNILVGQTNGSYALTATSSLGLTSSQWTTNGTNIYYNTGNVGIGTSTPLGTLNLSGTAPRLTLSDMMGSTNQKHWYMQSSSGYFYISTTSDALVDKNPITDSQNQPFIIAPNGSVGIGTPFLDSITSTLQIGGDFAFSATTGTRTIKVNQSGLGGLSGGSLAISAANGVTSFSSDSTGGSVSLTAGDGASGTASAVGGAISITAGAGAITGGNNALGSNVNITAGGGAGSSATLGKGGDIIMNGGTGTGVGNVILASLRGNVGIGSTSPWRKLSVNGSSDLGINALAGYFTATTTTASTFPYASTTALSATALCFTTDCRTSWASVGSAYPFGLTGNATSTLTQFNGGLTSYASTTIGGGTQTTGLTISGGATTTGNLRVGANGGNAQLSLAPTTSGNIFSIGTNYSSNLASLTIDGSEGMVISPGSTGTKFFWNNTTHDLAQSYQNFAVHDGGPGMRLTTVGLGIGTTSPWRALSVNGSSDLGINALAGYFTATTTTASTFPYASTTALSATSLCFTTDCRTSWASVGSAYPFGLSGNATSTLTQFNGGLTSYASTTIGGGTQATGLTINGGATTTGNAYFAGNVGVGNQAPSANLDIRGANTIDGLKVALTGQNPYLAEFYNTAYSSTNAVFQYFGYNNGEFRMGSQSTTGVGLYTNGQYMNPQIYLKSGGDVGIGGNAGGSSAGFSTPTLVALATGNVGIGTTSPYAALSVAGRGVFNQDVRADYYTATSTLVASTFPYASTTALTVSGTNGLQLASGLTGILQSVAGLVTSSSTLSINYGGTGLNTKPSYGNILVGQTNGSYALTATSSLGLTNTTIQQTYGTAQSGTITFATTSQNTNGLSVGLNITNTNGAFTFAATSSGVLTAAGGGTSIASPTAAGILLGTYAGGGWQQLATSSLGLAAFSYLFPSAATSTLLAFNGGLTSYASSTIGAGGQATGLTISGGATTTGNAYFAGNVVASGSMKATDYGTPASNASFSFLFNTTPSLIASGGQQMRWDGAALYPGTAGGATLGSSASPFGNGYFSGNVGIGTTSPFANFSIAGSAGGSTSLLAISTSTSGFATSTVFQINQNGNVSLLNGSTLTLNSLTGPLQAVNGLVSATSTLSINYGGTGLNTKPSYGNILVGQTNGTYVLTATSSLGITTPPAGGNYQIQFYNNGVFGGNSLLQFNPTTFGLKLVEGLNGYYADIYTYTDDGYLVINPGQGGSSNPFVAIGAISPGSKLSVFGNTAIGTTYGTYAAPTDGLLVEGSVGVGTTSPWRKFSVNGSSDLGINALAGYFTATTTTASTFPYASTTALSATSLCLSTDCRSSWSSVGSAYPFGLSGNATSTLAQFNGGLTSYASTTIGGGTQATGLTINGGATTTGSAYFGDRVGIKMVPNSSYDLSVAGNIIFSSVGNLLRTTDFAWIGNGVMRSGNSTGVVGMGGTNSTFGAWNVDSSTNGLAFYPQVDNSYDLGKTTNTIRNGYFSSKVGIGTTSPWGRLSVAATSSTDLSPIFVAGHSSTGSGTTTDFIIQGNSGTVGNVGIGTAAPTSLLDVRGTLAGTLGRLQNNSTSGYSAWDAYDSSGVQKAGFGYGNASVGSVDLRNRGYFWTPSGTDFVIDAGNLSPAPLLVSGTNGNVGIGTTSPWRTLSVKGSSDLGNNALAGYFTATTSTASVFPYASTTALTVSGMASTTNQIVSSLTSGRVTLVGAGGLLTDSSNFTYSGSTMTVVGAVDTQHVTASAGALRIDATTGFIGYGGSSSANYNHEFFGTMYTDSDFISSGIVYGAGFSGDGAGITGLDAGNITTGTLLIANGGTNSGSQTTNGVNYFNGTSITSGTGLTFNGTNFGIGTTSPYATLSVAGRGVFNQDVRANYYTATSTSVASTFPYASTTALSSTSLCLSTDCRTSWSSVGSAYPFGLSGNATSTLTQFNGGLTSYASTTIGAGGQTTGLTISGGATTTGNMYVAGNVGIGTTNPGYPLEVNGKLKSSRYLLGTDLSLIPVVGGQSYVSTWYSTVIAGNRQSAVDYTPSNVTGFGILTTDPAVIIPSPRATAPVLIVQGFSAQTADLQRWTDSNGATLSVVDKSGNVGIGTTTPWRKLSVNGSSDLGINALAGYFTATTTTASTFPYASTTALSATSLCLSTDCRTSWPTSSAGGGVGWASTTADTQSIYMYGTGNVGIGTSSPFTKLAVAGTITVNNINATSTTATSMFNGKLRVGSDSAHRVFETGYLTPYSVSIGDLDTIANGNTIHTDDGSGNMNTYSSGFTNLTGGGVDVQTDLILSTLTDGCLFTSGAYVQSTGVPCLTSDLWTSVTDGINYSGGKVGIGSSTPFATRLAIKGGGTGATENTIITNSNNRELFSISDNGNVKIGSSTATTGLLDVDGVISSGADGNIGGGELRSYQTPGFYLSLKTDTTLNKSGLLRSNASGSKYIIDYNTSNGDTELNSAFSASGNIIFSNLDVETGRIRNGMWSIGAGKFPAATLDITQPAVSTAKTAAYDALKVSNTATSSTASINKAGVEVVSTGTWNGASANNIGLYVSSVTGGTNNYDAIFNGGGNVGVATTSPWKKFSVTGNVAMSGLTASAVGNAVCISTNNEIINSGATNCAPSSIRFKENVSTLAPGYALDELSKLNIVGFDYKEKQSFETNHSYGMIAEDVEKIDKNLVDYGYDGQPVSLHFEKITGLLVQAVQEQQGQIGALATSTLGLTTSNVALSTSVADNTTNLQALTTNLASTSQTTRTLASALDTTNSTLSTLSSRIDELAATTSSIIAVFNDQTNTLIQDQLLTLTASTSFMATLASSTAAIIAPTIASTVASSTAETLASSTPSFIARVAIAVKESLQSMGDWTMDKMTAHIVYTDRLEAQTVAVSKGLEINDVATGQVFCIQIRNGDWDKRPGTCTADAPKTAQVITPLSNPPVAQTTPSVGNTAVTTTDTTTPTASSTTPVVPIDTATTTVNVSSVSTPDPVPAPAPSSEPAPVPAPEPVPAPAPEPTSSEPAPVSTAPSDAPTS